MSVRQRRLCRLKFRYTAADALLPGTPPRCAAQTMRGELATRNSPNERTQALRQLCDVNDGTRHTYAIASLSSVLYVDASSSTPGSRCALTHRPNISRAQLSRRPMSCRNLRQSIFGSPSTIEFDCEAQPRNIKPLALRTAGATSSLATAENRACDFHATCR